MTRTWEGGVRVVGHWRDDIQTDCPWAPVPPGTTAEQLAWLFYYFHALVTTYRLDPAVVHKAFAVIEEYAGPVGEHFYP